MLYRTLILTGFRIGSSSIASESEFQATVGQSNVSATSQDGNVTQICASLASVVSVFSCFSSITYATVDM